LLCPVYFYLKPYDADEDIIDAPDMELDKSYMKDEEKTEELDYSDEEKLFKDFRHYITYHLGRL
jgi:hypothetical protein